MFFLVSPALFLIGPVWGAKWTWLPEIKDRILKHISPSTLCAPQGQPLKQWQPLVYVVPLPSESHWKLWLQVSLEKTRHGVFKSITGQLSGFPGCNPPSALPRSREENSIWKRIFVLKFLFISKTTLKSCGSVMHFLSYQRGLITFNF